MSQPGFKATNSYGDRSIEERLVSKWLGEGDERATESATSLRQDTLQRIIRDLVISDSITDNLEAGHLYQVFNKHRANITIYKAASGLDKYLSNPEWRGEDEIIHEHQDEALAAMADSLAAGETKGHLVMATASGKAYLLAKATEAFAASGLRVLVLAHRKTISQQLGNHSGKGLRRFAKSMEPTDIALHYGPYKATQQRPVTVSTYSSLNRFSQTGELGEFDVILADEAHHALGEVTSENFDDFCPHAVKIGFTATPEYGLDKKLEHLLPKRVFEYNLRQAIEDGVVSPVQVLIYATGVEIPNLDKKHKDFTDRELEKLISLKSRNEKAVQAARDMVEAGRQGFIACVRGENRAHAYQIARLLSRELVTDKISGRKRQIRALAVTGEMEDEERDKILRDYEDGKIDLLTFVDVLGEGWDTDAASFGIDLCPTTSPVRKTQIMGRGLRRKAHEFIFIEFFDESAGKRQVSALQVLGEEQINLGKVISPPGFEWDSSLRRSYLRGIFNEDLWAELSSLDAKLVNELGLRQKKTLFDKEYQRYNSMLIAEGMPEEPVDTLLMQKYMVEAISRAIAKKKGARDKLKHTVEGYLQGGGSTETYEAREAWKEYLKSVLKQPAYPTEPVDPHELPGLIDSTNSAPDYLYDYLERDTRMQNVQLAVESLSERERKVLEARYGFAGVPQTLAVIGQRLDITPGRVNQIEGDTLKKLTADSRLYDGGLGRFASPFAREHQEEPVSIPEERLKGQLIHAIRTAEELVAADKRDIILRILRRYSEIYPHWKKHPNYYYHETNENDRQRILLSKRHRYHLQSATKILYEKYLNHVNRDPSAPLVNFSSITIGQEVWNFMVANAPELMHDQKVRLRITQALHRELREAENNPINWQTAFRSAHTFELWLRHMIAVSGRPVIEKIQKNQ